MATPVFRVLLIAITLLLGVTSGGVMAQTNYNFTFTSDGEGGLSAYINANISTDIANNATSISGIIRYNGSGDQTIVSLAGSVNPFGPSSPYTDVNGIYFTTGTDSFDLSYDSAAKRYQLDAGSTNNVNSAYSQSIVVTAGAPEIDGSLAPKVGFLLGCLFLMFGRKKQNTEPMMVA